MHIATQEGKDIVPAYTFRLVPQQTESRAFWCWTFNLIQHLQELLISLYHWSSLVYPSAPQVSTGCIALPEAYGEHVPGCRNESLCLGIFSNAARNETLGRRKHAVKQMVFVACRDMMFQEMMWCHLIGGFYMFLLWKWTCTSRRRLWSPLS